MPGVEHGGLDAVQVFVVSAGLLELHDDAVPCSRVHRLLSAHLRAHNTHMSREADHVYK